MIKFGFLFTDDGMTIYDITRDARGFVASLSAAPGVNFAAATEEEAIHQLKTFLYHRSMYNASFLAAPLGMSA